MIQEHCKKARLSTLHLNLKSYAIIYYPDCRLGDHDLLQFRQQKQGNQCC